MKHALVLIALLPLVVRAQAASSPGSVALVLEPCAASDLDTLSIVDRLRVELTSDGVGAVRLVDDAEVAATPADALGVAVLQVRASPCEPLVATFEVRIDDLLTHKHVERTIDLAEVPTSARARALALAVAELLRASWAELALAEEPPAGAPPAIVDAMRVRLAGLRDARALANPAPAPIPRPSVPAEAASRSAALALAGSFVVRAFPGARAALLGGRAALDLVPARDLVLRIDAEVAAGSSLDPLGAIDLGVATLGLTLAFAAPLGDAALITIGPRASAGAAWASGRPYDPSTLAGSGVGPLVYLGGLIELDITIAERFAVRFGVEVDGVAVGYEARVSAIPVAGVTGAGIGAWIGLAFAP